MQQPIFPLFYFGPIHYYAELVKHPQFIFETKERFPKRTYRNRCFTLGPNGPQNSSIPLKKWHHGKTLMEEIEISLIEPWPHEHWNTLKAGYGRSPFFEHYAPFIEPLYQNLEPQPLIRFLAQTHQTIAKLIGFNSRHSFSEKYIDIEEKYDYRKSFPTEKHLLTQSPSQNLATEPAPPYMQVFADRFPFVPNLTILDLLFNEGPNSITVLKSFR